MKKIGLLVLLVLIAVIGWSMRDHILQVIGRDQSEQASGPVASPELAEQANRKLEQLKDGETEQIALHAIEVQSLLKYRYLQLLPAFVDSPQVQIERSRIEFTARVPADHLPRISELGDAAAFLPDTTEVAIKGALLPLDSGRVALSIEQVRAARIPLPQRLIPRALERLGRKPERGLPRNALALPLPTGVGSATLVEDSLVLRRR